MNNTTSFGAWHSRLTSPTPTHLHAIVLTLICTIGFVVRVNGIGEQVIWYDETVSWSQSRRDFIDMLRVTSWDNYPPLHNTILYAVIKIFSDSETALRLPSALLGTLNIALLYALGRILGSSTAGLLAAALLALSPFHIWYSQEARPYALLGFCATLFVLAVFMALRTEKRRWYAISTIAALLLLYTHPYGPLLWGSLGAAILFCAVSLPAVRARHLKLVAWQMLPAAGFAPWAFILLGRTEAINKQGFWIPYPTLDSIGGLFRDIAYSELMLAIAVPAILAALLRPLPRSDNTPAPAPHDISGFEIRTILFAWLVGPFALGLAMSLIAQPVLISRYLICSFPAAILLMAIGFSRLMVNRVLSAVAIAILLVGVVSSLRAQHPEFRRDWRGVVAAISGSLRDDDCLAVARNFETRPFEYYSRGFMGCVLSVANLLSFDPSGVKSPRLWLVAGYFNACESDAAIPCLNHTDIENAVARFVVKGWQKSEMREWDGITIVLFERRNS